MDIIYEEHDLKEVLNYFAKDFFHKKGKKVVSHSAFVDAVSDKAIFKLMITDAEPEVQWDCHEHRDEFKVSNWGSYVYHPEKGVLSQTMRHYDAYINVPIAFKDNAAAYKWIKEGTIAEVQENLTDLQVGFSLELLKSRK